MKEVNCGIAEKFTVKVLGELHHFLGVKVMQNKKAIAFGLVKKRMQEN